MSIGVDVVDVERFRTLVRRTPGLEGRFFTSSERHYCRNQADPPVRFAGTFAAKEAVMKVLNLTPAPAWARRIEILRASDGSPVARVDGRRVVVSVSHDGGIAVAAAMRDPNSAST